MAKMLSRGEKTFLVFNYLFLGVLVLVSIYPMWDVVRVSLSPAHEVGAPGIRLWPEEPTLAAYETVMGNRFIWLGYRNTIVRIAVGMLIRMALTILVAYALSKRRLPLRNTFTLLIVFTMFFRGGMIPDYLLVRSLGMLNTVWALVLPRAIDTFAMIIMRNFFMSIPPEMHESARMDGASELTTLIRIILPLSTAVLATVSLWGIVWHWNQWFDSIIYVRDADLHVLQAVLRRIVIELDPEMMGRSEQLTQTTVVMAEGVKAASIIVATIPILLVYPFLQKHFVKGIMVGSLKG